jgi:hypothetical protein
MNDVRLKGDVESLEIFTWKNCQADIGTARHGLTVQGYVKDVVVPAIRTLEEKISDLEKSDDPVAAFEMADVESILREAKMAFALSIQSIWERQLRVYLEGCARELRKDESLTARVLSMNWEKLCALFHDLRDIRIEDFPSFAELDTLQLLGNACRHGDGASAQELARRCPELWPAPMPPDIFVPAGEPSPKLVSQIEIPTEKLRHFADVIAAFWDDAEYIYCESLQRKHPNLEARLVRERVERKWRPRASS